MVGPDSHELPLFAYGIFRRDEIAYPNIEPSVETVASATARGGLLERDGVFLLDIRGRDDVAGDLIQFRPGTAEQAYSAINAMEPDHLYRWDTCTAATASGQREANVLVGKRPGRGSHVPDRIYRSRDDPLFVEAIAEVKRMLAEPASNPISEFLRLQMTYLLLWISIERYCTLRWGFAKNMVTQRVLRLAEERAFQRALKRHIHVSERRRVVRADDPGKAITLDRDDPEKSVKFYYQVRSNIAHRGKTILVESDLVRTSLAELMNIFTDVLNETLGKPDSSQFGRVW